MTRPAQQRPANVDGAERGDRHRLDPASFCAPSRRWNGTGRCTARRDSTLEDAALVFVKSPSHFRASFGPAAARILAANTPDLTAPDMRRIPFTQGDASALSDSIRSDFLGFKEPRR